MKKLALLAVGLFHVACIDASAGDSAGDATSESPAISATRTPGFEVVYMRDGEIAAITCYEAGQGWGGGAAQTLSGNYQSNGDFDPPFVVVQDGEDFGTDTGLFLTRAFIANTNELKF